MTEQKEMTQEDITKITKEHPMHYLDDHPFFMVRWINDHRKKLLRKKIGDVDGKVIADIGCEAGNLLSDLCSDFDISKIYAVDLSDYALERAEEKAEEEGWAGITDFIISDAQDIKIDDNKVDVTVSSNVLEHLEDPQKGFDELVRITRPGGRIVVHVPNEKMIIFFKKILKGMAPKLMGDLQVVTPGHLHYPDKKFLKDLFNNCPYEIEIKSFQKGPRISIIGLYFYVVIEKKDKDLF